MEAQNQIERKTSDITIITKEVWELKKIIQKLLELEEKSWQEKEQTKKEETKKKKSVEESLWWKKITAYASIITAVTTIIHFVSQILSWAKKKTS